MLSLQSANLRRVLITGMFLLTGPFALAQPAKHDAEDDGERQVKRTGFVPKRFKHADGTVSNYQVFVPHNYNDIKTEVPVILFLHGSGEVKGENNSRPSEVGLGPHIRGREKSFPFLVLFPRALEEGWRVKNVNGELAFGILDKTLKEYRADKNRVSLTGLSMGGSGTWNFALAEPDRWAAIVPICGFSHPERAGRIKDLPCWVFHGAADQRISVSQSRDMVAALKKAGGKPRYTEIPNTKHDCWDQAYSTPALWTWLAQQKRQ